MATKEEVIEVLKTINDPEIQIDVWTLELIYDIKIENNTIKIKMTFTTPLYSSGHLTRIVLLIARWLVYLRRNT